SGSGCASGIDHGAPGARGGGRPGRARRRPGPQRAGGCLLRQGAGDDGRPARSREPRPPAAGGGSGVRPSCRPVADPGRDGRDPVTALLLLLLLLSSATPVLEAEIDSQTREDDELPPSSVTPYTPRFEGKTLNGIVCGPEVKNASVKKLL